MKMDKRVQMSILLDLYGELLTDKQKNIMELYFNDDLSLAEISELNNTSRQATYDIINRCQKLLLQYDSKLRLLEKELLVSEIRKNVKEKLTLLMKKNISEDEINIINSIIEDIEGI
jgi:hypothetical protein